MFSKILVPYDGSKPADKAIEYAANIAKSASDKEGCQVVLLHIIPRIPASPLFIERPMSTSEGRHIPLSEYIERLYTEMQKHAAEMLERKEKEVENTAGSKVTVKTAVLLSDPIAEKIVELAKTEKVDLIVIGNVGLSGILKLKTLGSVSRAVSERAPCPVLIIH
jgi:nucleotide-binding universal stress UspA family protein